METLDPVLYGRKWTKMGFKVVEVDPDSDAVGEDAELDEEVVDEVHEEVLQREISTCCVVGTESTSRDVLPLASARESQHVGISGSQTRQRRWS